MKILANGTFSYPNFEVLQNQSHPFLQLGLEVGLALAPNQSAIESGVAAVQDVIDLAHRLQVTSIMVDYEPRTNITLAHAQSYATFIADLRLALHSRDIHNELPYDWRQAIDNARTVWPVAGCVLASDGAV